MEPRNPDDLDALRAASDVLGIDALLTRRRARRAGSGARIRRRTHPARHRGLVRPGSLPGRAGAGARRAGRAGHDPRWVRMPRPQRRRVRPRGARARGRRQRHPHVRVGAGLARDGLDPPLGKRGAEAGVAAADGARRGDRMLRPHRARRRLRPRRHEDVRPARRRATGSSPAPSAGSASPRSRRSRWCGRRPTTACGASSFRPMRAGFHATPLEPKGSMRASVQCELRFDDIRLPAGAMLPGARGLRGPFSALNEARYGIIWGSLGAARDSYEAALRHALRREQFDRPIASFQLTQQKLVNMVLELQKGALLALHTGRMKDAGTLTPDADLGRQAQQRPRGDRDRARGAHHPRRRRRAARELARSGTPRTSSPSAPTRARTRCTPSSSAST